MPGKVRSVYLWERNMPALILHVALSRKSKGLRNKERLPFERHCHRDEQVHSRAINARVTRVSSTHNYIGLPVRVNDKCMKIEMQFSFQRLLRLPYWISSTFVSGSVTSRFDIRCQLAIVFHPALSARTEWKTTCAEWTNPRIKIYSSVRYSINFGFSSRY